MAPAGAVDVEGAETEGAAPEQAEVDADADAEGLGNWWSS